MKHIYLNNLTKKLITTFIVFTMLTCNASFALNDYFKINNSSNKSINILLSKTVFNGDLVFFSTKYFKDDDKYIVNKIAINVKEKTGKLVKRDILDKKEILLDSEDFSYKNEFKPIKDGTLMADLYDIAVIMKSSSETFSKNPKVWQKYFKKIENKISRRYHPNILRWKQGLSTENKFVSIVVLVDKNGKVLSYEYENYYPVKYKNFDDKFKAHVDNIFLKKDNFFPPLPKEYSGDKIIMRFGIGYAQDIENKVFMKYNSYPKGTGTIELNKSTTPFVTLPLAIYTIAEGIGIIGITFAAIPVGIFAPDATDKFTSKLYEKL